MNNKIIMFLYDVFIISGIVFRGIITLAKFTKVPVRKSSRKSSWKSGSPQIQNFFSVRFVRFVRIRNVDSLYIVATLNISN